MFYEYAPYQARVKHETRMVCSGSGAASPSKAKHTTVGQ